MKRLRELAPGDGLMARAHDLIDALGPTVLSEARMLRVRRALEQPIRRPRGFWALRGMLGFAVVAGGASALAFSGGFSSPAPHVEPAPTSLEAAVAPRPRPAPAPPLADRSERLAEASGNRSPVGTPRGRRSGASVSPSASPSDVGRIHEAAKALRGDGDPARALRLLESSEKVGGPLAEEALALRIEAASAAGDPRATSLAHRYLSRYPGGRYREVARRTLEAR